MDNRINVRTLKSKLTLEDHKKVMKALDIPALSENKSEIIYFSGDKNINALQGSPKLYFYKDTGIYVGYTSATTYDIISLTQRRLSLLKQPCAFMDAINFILSVTGKELDSVQRINKPHICNWEDGLGKFIRHRRGEACLEPYDDSILSALDDIYYQGWIDEGISIDTMMKYEIKWYPRCNQIVLPCRDRLGQLIGIRVRNLDPDRIDYAKYQPLTLLDGTDYRFNTNDTFYGISHNWANIEQTGKVILVEGEKSVLKGEEFFGRDNNVLALYGSHIGTVKRNTLIKMGVKEVVLALDSDFHEASQDDRGYVDFERKILNLAKLFKGYAEVQVMYNNIGATDMYKASPFDFDKARFDELWKNRIIL